MLSLAIVKLPSLANSQASTVAYSQIFTTDNSQTLTKDNSRRVIVTNNLRVIVKHYINQREALYKYPSTIQYNNQAKYLLGRPQLASFRSRRDAAMWMVVAHLRTSMLNGFWRFPRYSPTICLLRPLRLIRNFATAFGRWSRNRLMMRYRTPFSGFLM